jgi:hypothetical protein
VAINVKAGYKNLVIMFSGKLRIFLSFLLLILPAVCFCQTTNFIPNIIPPSPNASALMKFADVPVSTYTGTANVSVPIYNIQARGISVPISLDYSTGGIKLKEEAGWVGLGWSLNAGGMISRTIMGLDDFGGEYFGSWTPDITGNLISQPFYTIPFYPSSPANALGLFGYDFFCNDSVYTDQGNKDFSFTLQGSAPTTDLEPDIFRYNFLGRSGKFIINRSGKVIIQKQENIIIQYAANGSSFTIIDDQGNKFYFQDLEFTEPASGPPQTTSSWLLSKIITQQNDTVKFNYTTDNTWTNVAGDPYEIFRTACEPNNVSATGTSVTNTYLNRTLQNIDFVNGQVQFSFDSSRTDLLHGKKLNGIKIYSKNAAGTLTYVKEHKLYYSYFNSSPSLELQRLRLDSIKEVSGNLAIPPYSFLYNIPSFYAGKHAYNVDHWGYFSGNKNGYSQFTPEFNGYFPIDKYQRVTGFVYIPGPSRDPDSASMKAFSLQQVNYPTGGQTVFQYEPNFYDDVASSIGPRDYPQMHLIDTTHTFYDTVRGTTTGSIDLSNIFLTQQMDPNINFSVTFKAFGTADTSIYRNRNGMINFTFNGTYVDMSQTNGLSCGGTVCTTGSVPFQVNAPGIYNWTAYIDPSVGAGFDGIYFSISWQEDATKHYKNSTFMAGGLRVKTITDYSAPGIVSKQRRYDYSYMATKFGWPNTSFSYGKLMSYPNYARYEQTIVSDPNGAFPCSLLTRTSGSNVSLNSEIQGNIVGYDQVAEYTVDPVTGNDIGKTVYSYFNSPDTTIFYNGFRLPGLLNIGNNLNGLLTSKMVYRDSANTYLKVSETDNYYHTTNRIAYLNMKCTYIPNLGGVAFGCPVSNVPQYLCCFYPSIKSEKILQDLTQETVYDQIDISKFITTTKSFYYDNPLHYLLTRSGSIDSKGNTLISQIKYPQDFIPNGLTLTNNTILDSLIGRNMVNGVIEKRDSLYYTGTITAGKVTSAQLTKYKFLTAGTMGIDKQYRFDQMGPVGDFQPYAISGNTSSQDSRYRQMISFDSYDNTNNIAQYTATDQTPVAILWDYKNLYPIAQVRNAVLTDIAFTSFEADGNGNWNVTSTTRDTVNFITGKKSYNLSSGSISKTGLVSAKVYMVTYWSRNGSYSISGGTVTSKTGRVVNGWTYYEQTVTTSSTSITISGSGNIDELRLYPQGAQMTSFTYAPLVGETTINDLNSEITYYEYDSLTRLKNIKDYQGNIIKNYQYNYAQACIGCALVMKNLGGTATISYPVGVFSVANKFLGNATTPAIYISLWNSDAGNHVIGTLAAGSDSMHFILTVNSGQSSPGYVTGCRYYQYDLSYTNLDGVRNGNGSYVDFGDGTGMFLGKGSSDSLVTKAANTINYLDGNTIYWVHTYPDSSQKTISFYHNDAATAAMTLDNHFAPANSLMRVKNLRGNIPQYTTWIDGDCFQQSSALTVSAITNWNSISSITEFDLVTGDYLNPCLHVSYAQNFMSNNKNLRTINTSRGYYLEGYEDTTFKISRLKSNWNVYFTNLNLLTICDDHWNREDLSSLTQLNLVQVVAGNLHHSFNQTNNPLVPLPVSVIDNVINQVAAGAGKSIVNGYLNLYSGGTTRSSASDAGFNTLKSKGWTIVINGINY